MGESKRRLEADPKTETNGHTKARTFRQSRFRFGEAVFELTRDGLVFQMVLVRGPRVRDPAMIEVVHRAYDHHQEQELARLQAAADAAKAASDKGPESVPGQAGEEAS